MDGLSLPNMHQLGRDRGRGNLLGIEPYMTLQDYASKESFFNKLNGYLLIARREKYMDRKTIVLFPEYLGTWLALAGESEPIFEAETLQAAERRMVFHHPLKYLSFFLKSREKGRAEAAFFRMKASQMAEIYQDTFSQIAREYSLITIAGSIVLPAPQISGGQLITHQGPLYNASVIYGPDGIARQPLISKAFPTARELLFTTPGLASDIPAFDTPAGRLGVLVCADSWYPPAYAALKKQRIDLLAVPSYDASGMQRWNQPWRGYDGWPAPPDVNLTDIEKITEGQAWHRYALAGRMRASGAAYGMNVFLRGKLWNQDLGGWPATLVREAEVFVEEQTQKAAILSLWL